MTSTAHPPGGAPGAGDGAAEAGERSVGALALSVLREGLQLVAAELVRARAELELRSRHAMRLLWRAGLVFSCLVIGLQALAVAAIVASSELFDGYVTGALVVAGAFLFLALLALASVQRVASQALRPVPAHARAGVSEPGPGEEEEA
jgi:hypothetical protein